MKTKKQSPAESNPLKAALYDLDLIIAEAVFAKAHIRRGSRAGSLNSVFAIKIKAGNIQEKLSELSSEEFLKFVETL